MSELKLILLSVILTMLAAVVLYWAYCYTMATIIIKIDKYIKSKTNKRNIETS